LCSPVLTAIGLVNRYPHVLNVGGPNMPQINPRWWTAAILNNRKILISS